VRSAQPAAQRHAAAPAEERPGLKHLLVHNIDTAGVDLDAALLGYHIEEGRR